MAPYDLLSSLLPICFFFRIGFNCQMSQFQSLFPSIVGHAGLENRAKFPLVSKIANTSIFFSPQMLIHFPIQQPFKHQNLQSLYTPTITSTAINRAIDANGMMFPTLLHKFMIYTRFCFYPMFCFYKIIFYFDLV